MATMTIVTFLPYDIVKKKIRQGKKKSNFKMTLKQKSSSESTRVQVQILVKYAQTSYLNKVSAQGCVNSSSRRM